MYPDKKKKTVGLRNANMGESSAPTLLQYEEEWSMLCRQDVGLKSLRECAKEGGLRASRFRSVIWQLFLGSLSPGSSARWPSESTASREHYINLKKSLTVDPYQQTEPTDNPLRQDDQSTWHQYFCNEQLRNVIRQDVIRTFPGTEFFKSEKVQETMIDILFCYARENPSLCYRQGMHEILAPILFVVHCDYQALLHTQEQSLVKEDITVVVDPRYLEEDSYTIFRKVMSVIEGAYHIYNMAPTSTGYFPTNNTSVSRENNQAVVQLNWIKDKLLAPIDPDLHAYLKKMDIELPLFGIRWLRLLFGREFPLHDLLVLWDAIFAECFELINYLVVAMLVAIRRSILNEDYTACMTSLMRYPQNSDISCIIEYALHLKNPRKYKIPAKILHLQQPEPPKADYIAANNHVNYRHPPRIYVAIPNHQIAQRSNGREIVDGFTLNDPEMLLKELKHAQNVMALCRIKLLQYHQTLETSISPNNFQAVQALTGIHELSSLLSAQIRKPPTSQHVETAYEAEEKLVLTPTSKPSSPVGKPSQNPTQVDMIVFNLVLTPLASADQEDYWLWKLERGQNP